MFMTADIANKRIKNLQADLDAALKDEERSSTYTCGVSETRHPPDYDFLATQYELESLRKEIAKLRHAVNRFNITQTIEMVSLAGTEQEAFSSLALALHMPALENETPLFNDALLVRNAVKVVKRIAAQPENKHVSASLAELNCFLENPNDAIRDFYLPLFEKVPAASQKEVDENEAITRFFLDDYLPNEEFVSETKGLRIRIRNLLDKNTMTIDEALFRMSTLHRDKQRLYEMLQVPEQTRTRGFGGREADFVIRNYELDDVQSAYDATCDELMLVQQRINIANLTISFEVV